MHLGKEPSVPFWRGWATRRPWRVVAREGDARSWRMPEFPGAHTWADCREAPDGAVREAIALAEELPGR
jgi:hypothetical protein